jgi:hypothetical protein
MDKYQFTYFIVQLSSLGWLTVNGTEWVETSDEKEAIQFHRYRDALAVLEGFFYGNGIIHGR